MGTYTWTAGLICVILFAQVRWTVQTKTPSWLQEYSLPEEGQSLIHLENGKAVPYYACNLIRKNAVEGHPFLVDLGVDNLVWLNCNEILCMDRPCNILVEGFTISLNLFKEILSCNTNDLVVELPDGILLSYDLLCDEINKEHSKISLPKLPILPEFDYDAVVPGAIIPTKSDPKPTSIIENPNRYVTVPTVPQGTTLLGNQPPMVPPFKTLPVVKTLLVQPNPSEHCQNSIVPPYPSETNPAQPCQPKPCSPQPCIPPPSMLEPCPPQLCLSEPCPLQPCKPIGLHEPCLLQPPRPCPPSPCLPTPCLPEPCPSKPCQPHPCSPPPCPPQLYLSEPCPPEPCIPKRVPEPAPQPFISTPCPQPPCIPKPCLPESCTPQPCPQTCPHQTHVSAAILSSPHHPQHCLSEPRHQQTYLPQPCRTETYPLQQWSYQPHIMQFVPFQNHMQSCPHQQCPVQFCIVSLLSGNSYSQPSQTQHYVNSPCSPKQSFGYEIIEHPKPSFDPEPIVLSEKCVHPASFIPARPDWMDSVLRDVFSQSFPSTIQCTFSSGFHDPTLFY